MEALSPGLAGGNVALRQIDLVDPMLEIDDGVGGGCGGVQNGCIPLWAVPVRIRFLSATPSVVSVDAFTVFATP